MGWETRHDGRLYLYRNRRVKGKPVKEYLGANDAFGSVMSHDLHRLQRREAKVRELTRKIQADFRRRVDGLMAAIATQNMNIRIFVGGILCSFGYHQHHRGEWRMKRDLQKLKAMIEQLKGGDTIPVPIVAYQAPTKDTEAVDLFAKARAGDVEAQNRVQALIRDRKWIDWIGDVGRQATRQLIHRAANGDPVWVAGISEKVNAIRQKLLGENPSVLEELLVRRIENGWLAVHLLELESTVRVPADLKSREHLDRSLSRAQRRFTEAIGELARIRRLQTPRLLAQLNFAAAQTVVNAS